MTRFSSSRSDRIPIWIQDKKRCVTTIVSLSRAHLIATHTTSQSYSHSINPKRLVINAGDTDHHPTTRTHARALILGKRIQKKHIERHTESHQDEERERRKKMRIPTHSTPYILIWFNDWPIVRAHTHLTRTHTHTFGNRTLLCVTSSTSGAIAFPLNVPHKFVNRSNFTFHINLWAFDFDKSQMRAAK